MAKSQVKSGARVANGQRVAASVPRDPLTHKFVKRDTATVGAGTDPLAAVGSPASTPYPHGAGGAAPAAADPTHGSRPRSLLARTFGLKN